jgi:uncharacterized protein
MMAYPSCYNHLLQVDLGADQTRYLLTNLFFGASCTVSEPVYEAFCEAEKTGFIEDERLPGEAGQYFLERGFLWADPEAEETLLAGAAQSLGDRSRLAAGLNGGHYGFITSLYCNLACPYCFQQAHADSCGFLAPRQVDLGLAAIERCEAQVAAHGLGENNLPKVSITGGEPLLQNKVNLALLEYLLEKLEEKGWPYSITTNGTELARFVQSHTPTRFCRNIQVTLDGPRSIHDGRRCFRGGDPSFDAICAGLEAALSAGWPMTLRVNLDLTNVEHLPTLADFVREQGWLGYDNFYAYVSPVTDHGSIAGPTAPGDEADLLEGLLAVVDRAPELRQVFDIRHFRGFDYVERMLLHKNPKNPVLFRCEAVMGMYIFDPHGDVHVCLEAVGDRGRRVGTYDPAWNLDEAAFGRWTHRNVLTLPECRGCKIRFICAGGCTIESFNHNGKPCCMPFLREIDLAWSYYASSRSDLF